jgi:acetyl-CoA carboxylase carboxyltransferase component
MDSLIQERIERNREIETAAKAGTGKVKPGKLSARKRLEFLFDEGSFEEIDLLVKNSPTGFDRDGKRFYTDGIITGFGQIKGRTAYAYAQDFSILGGSLGERHAEKICKVMDLAAKAGCPMVGINDSGGARIQEGVNSLAGYGNIFLRNVRNSGVIPQISLIMGPCAGGAVYSPSVTDFVIMVKGSSYMFVTGPKVIKSVTYEDIDFESLGGAKVHSEKSGVCHMSAENDMDCILKARRLLSYLPQNNLDEPMVYKVGDDPKRENTLLNEVIPAEQAKSYDVKIVVNEILDRNSFFEVHADFAKNIVVGFGRLDGQTVGVVANQPLVLAGAMDIDCSRKAARFVRTCNCFSIPIITLIDVPGFLPGTDQEHAGIITHGAKLLFAYAESTVPKISVIMRKAYGGAYIVMSSKHIGGDYNLAWPMAEIAVMGGKGAVEILYKRELEGLGEGSERYQQLLNQYNETFLSPYLPAERGFIDAIIEPTDTRKKIISFLNSIISKRETNKLKRNCNVPL